jgi:hypothetical protein
MENAVVYHEGGESDDEGAQAAAHGAAGAGDAEEADVDLLNGETDKPLALDELFKEEYKISKIFDEWCQRKVPPKLQLFCAFSSAGCSFVFLFCII